ncbi:stealth family protein [Nocardiopsis sp. L17-MgMaSL7]|uniref:stealth family protein n=1 Tax=Nocardiopsis sp. L17-MgMaSL7 TaxID=1938893 RepID=UPI000D719247|nr:stealth family protein [Nocardiopsis sp. L17-MgMaSL7]PWV57614.1 Stealth-like protein [Nocardiopsis sp. L17-MgMaSL7]
MPLASRIKSTGERFLPQATRERLETERQDAAARVAEERRLAKISKRREALLMNDSTVRAFSLGDGEFLGRTVERFTAAGASARNLELVTAALEHAGVDYFLVRGRSPLRHVVGVHRSERKRVLDAMRELYGNSPLFAIKPGSGGVVSAFSAYVDGALAEEVKSGLVIRFAEPLLSPSGQVLAGFEYGCDVQFWRDGATLLERDNLEELLGRLRVQAPAEVLADSLVAPTRNRVADVLPASQRKPATLTVNGREHPTFEPFTWKLADDVDFPIDVVYTWVDGEDPEHATKRARHQPESASAHEHASNSSRFTSRDELRYSLRSLEAYAPFVRNVYLVTDGQVPAWLDTEAPGISVVDHRDILPAEALPTFNSHAIESRLHHISGLAEHWLYLNDDVFLARPVRAGQFFHANGIAQVPFSPFQFGTGDPVSGEPAPNSAGKNVRALLERDFGRAITNKFKHAPHPQVRQVALEMEERYREELERTARSRFRSLSDVAFTATLHHHYAVLTGRAVPGEYRMRYVNIGLPDAAERLEALQSAEVDFFCLNDVDTPEEAQEAVALMVHGFLEPRFPFPSRYEKSS